VREEKKKNLLERLKQPQNKVRKENEFMDVVFQDISNTATYHSESDTTIRKCHFSGTSSGKPFSVSFTMTEPSMAISHLVFDVGIEMQMDIGALLAL
jgi:hypothetical protein